MTERAKFTFAVRQDEDGTPWIAAEALLIPLPGVEGDIGFDLVPGTTLEQAHEIARYLRRHIDGLSTMP